jgi:ABC-type uncharacterized transport system involved in gliding motility auxiliary subunit
MNRKLLSLSALVAAGALFFAVNIISDGLFRSARLDLTENGLYTLSPGTRNILAAVDEPVTLRFFFSDALAGDAPQMRSYGNRVRDLLSEYVSLSGGKLRLEVIDPEPFSDAEDRAVAFGLQGAAINAAGDTFYFGLVGTNTVDDSEVIPFFSPQKEEFLEYDLTKLVYSLSNPKKPVVGLISTWPLEFGPGGLQMAMRGQSQPFSILTAMRQFFTVRTLRGEQDTIPEDVDILVLIHPRGLSKKTLYAIDQFVLAGGRAMIFIDPYSETAAALPPEPGTQPNPMDSHGSNLEKLLAAWGVSMDGENVVGDHAYATRVNAGTLARRQVIDFLPWLRVPAESLSRGDVVTAELDVLMLASAGHLVDAEGAETGFAPLVTSSQRSMLIEAGKVRFRPDPEGLLADFAADDERYVLAARLDGTVKSAFEGPPAEPEDEAEAENEASESGEETAPRPHLASSQEAINVIVVADADMLDDRFWLQRQNLLGQELVIPTTSNADFLVNGIDNLAGSNDLISLRSRARSDRPFQVIEDIRREAEQRFLAREKALQEKLEETEQRIADLQSKATAGSGALLSEEEAKAIESFRQEMLATRKELRNVQHSLRKDIETVEARIKFANIGLVPLAVFLVALGLALFRYRSRQAAAALKQA